MKPFSPRLIRSLSAGVLAFFGAALFVSPGTASAQFSERVSATIPFDFQSNSRTFKAGQYSIDRLSDHAVTLSSPSAKRILVLMVMDAQTARPSMFPKLVFHRYGEKYFLYQIWKAGSSTGIQFPRTRAEKEELRALNAPRSSTIELALNTAPR